MTVCSPERSEPSLKTRGSLGFAGEMCTEKVTNELVLLENTTPLSAEGRSQV